MSCTQCWQHLHPHRTHVFDAVRVLISTQSSCRCGAGAGAGASCSHPCTWCIPDIDFSREFVVVGFSYTNPCRYQLPVHIHASIAGASRLPRSLEMSLPLQLKHRSHSADIAGIDRASRANRERSGQIAARSDHHSIRFFTSPRLTVSLLI
jgi:hypothetical protein